MLSLNPDDVTPEKPLQSEGLYLTISAQTAARCQPGCETEKAVWDLSTEVETFMKSKNVVSALQDEKNFWRRMVEMVT